MDRHDPCKYEANSPSKTRGAQHCQKHGSAEVADAIENLKLASQPRLIEGVPDRHDLRSTGSPLTARTGAEVAAAQVPAARLSYCGHSTSVLRDGDDEGKNRGGQLLGAAQTRLNCEDAETCSDGHVRSLSEKQGNKLPPTSSTNFRNRLMLVLTHSTHEKLEKRSEH